MFEKKVILTGVKPTGTPHLGNYLGAIKPAIKLGRGGLAAGGPPFLSTAGIICSSPTIMPSMPKKTRQF